MSEEEYPNLSKFLQEALPSLGLDNDTYCPYVLGTTEGGGEDSEEELEQVVQLLQASATNVRGTNARAPFSQRPAFQSCNCFILKGKCAWRQSENPILNTTRPPSV